MNIAKSIAVAAAVATTLASSMAFADEPSTGASWSGGTTAPATTPMPGTTTLNVAKVAEEKPDDTVADHDKFVGHFAIGFLGASDIPLPTGPSATGIATGSLTAPTIGARYWLNKRIGIDAGLGIGLAGGSSEGSNGTRTETADSPSRFGLLIHGGVPIALVRGKHYTFEVIPELNIGFATSSIKGQGATPVDTSLSGFRFDIGARAGAEIHFGFIGIPELALQATVGLNLAIQSQKVSAGNVSVSQSTTAIGTTVQADPWALFTRNISALYYF